MTGDLTAYNVIYNETSGQIEHTWNTSSYTSIAKINIYSADSENGEYSQIYSVDPGTFVRKYAMDTIETNKTYWFKARAFDEDDFLIRERGPFKIDVPESKPPKVLNLDKKMNNLDLIKLTWNKSVQDKSYIIKFYEDSSLSTLLFETTSDTNEYEYPMDLSNKSSTTFYYVVSAVNDLGQGDPSDKVFVTRAGFPSLVQVTSEVSDITNSSAKVTLDFKRKSGEAELSFKNPVSFQYALEDSAGNEYKAYQDSPVFDLTGLEFASSNTFVGKVKVLYSYDGQNKEVEIKGSRFDIKTKSFEAPQGQSWTLVEKGRKFITIQFPKLTSRQCGSIDPQDIVYVVKAYYEDSTYSSKEVTSQPGQDSVTITGLASDSEYHFTVAAKMNIDGSLVGEESEKSAAFVTRPALSKPVITSITETSPQSPYTHMTVSFSPIAEDSSEEIKYGLVWDILNSRYSFCNGKSEQAQADITQITEKVNGGNRYNVYLYAYEANEGETTSVYSAMDNIQLAAINDKSIPGGLYYGNEEDILNYGNLCDIVNPATWDTGLTPRSEGGSFRWAFIEKTGYYALKFTLTPEMLDLDIFNQRLLFGVQRQSHTTYTIDNKTLAYGVKFDLLDPAGNKVSGYADYSTDRPIDSLKIPDFSNTWSSLFSPANDSYGDWVSTLEDYMFNNSIYLGITVPEVFNEGNWNEKSNEGNIVAFSYYYIE